MADLTVKEKIQLENLFQIGSCYVIKGQIDNLY